MLDQMVHKRPLIFDCAIQEESKPNLLLFGLEPMTPRAESASMIDLNSCFREYCKEEYIGGDDQWYCNKCKEHRDITKKLEIYRTPKILCI